MAGLGQGAAAAGAAGRRGEAHRRGARGRPGTRRAFQATNTKLLRTRDPWASLTNHYTTMRTAVACQASHRARSRQGSGPPKWIRYLPPNEGLALECAACAARGRLRHPRGPHVEQRVQIAATRALSKATALTVECRPTFSACASLRLDLLRCAALRCALALHDHRRSRTGALLCKRTGRSRCSRAASWRPLATTCRRVCRLYPDMAPYPPALCRWRRALRTAPRLREMAR